MSLEESTKDEITTTIENNSVVVFMKGNRTQPQCGFSASVIQILDQMATEYETVGFEKASRLSPIGPPFPNFISTVNSSVAAILSKTCTLLATSKRN